MKRKFSTSWKGSSQPRKKRKYQANAPLHLRKKFLSINLSKELRKKQAKRNMIAKKGDKVKVFSGKFKGKTGKILSIDLKKSKVIIEEINVKKMDGSKASVRMQPSNLQIIELAERAMKKKKENKETGKKEEEKKNETEKPNPKKKEKMKDNKKGESKTKDKEKKK